MNQPVMNRVVAHFSGDKSAAVIEVSGPFALFRRTLLYGRALGEVLLMPFRRALRAILGKEEVERLVETIPGVGLRLNVAPRECRILEPMNTASR